jgi:hypothetical protein
MTPHEDPEALSAYLDGALDAGELSRVEGHLASCEECSNLRTRLKVASSAVASLGETSLDVDESRKLRQSVLDATSKRSSWLTPARLAGALGAAALIGAGVIGLNVMTQTAENPTADLAGRQGSLEEAAPAAISEQTFNSPEELLAIAKEDPDVLRGVTRFTVSDVGEVQDGELQRSTNAGEEAQSDIASSDSTYGAAAAVSPTPLWGCHRKVLQEKPYPTVPIAAKPAVYKGEKAWMLVYAFTYSHEENAALDYIRLQLVRRTDCGLLVEQVFKPTA